MEILNSRIEALDDRLLGLSEPEGDKEKVRNKRQEGKWQTGTPPERH